MGLKSVDWMHQSQDRDKMAVFGNAIENIRVPQNENFLAIRELISFSENAFALRS
jgi:hypothetical protein